MKVLQINPYPPDHLGGSEIFCKNLARNLKSKMGIKSDILTSDIFKKGVKTEYLDNSIKVIYRKCFHNLWGKNPIVYIYDYLKKNYLKYDVIHAHSFIFFTTFQSALLRKLRKFPFVLHIHGGVQTPSSLGSNISEYLQLISKSYLFDKSIGKVSLNNSDAMISVSAKDLKVLRTRYHLQEDKLHYIPNAVDTEKFKKYDSIEKKYITFIGRLSYVKGFDIFIELIKKLHDKEPSYKFLIIGNGPLDYLVKQNQKALDIEHYTSYPYEKIQQIYNMSKILILSSRFEGIPTTILESLSCETPVIASNVGGVSEVLINEKNGLLFRIEQNEEIVEKIIGLIKDEGKLKKLGSNGRELIKTKFSWINVTKKVSNVYDQLVYP